MQAMPLPPTWTAVESATKIDRGKDSPHRAPSAADGLDTPLLEYEYVNCVTRERTSRHPGASYFRGVVEQERKLQRGSKLGRPASALTAHSTQQLPGVGAAGTSGIIHQESPVAPTKTVNSDIPAQEDTTAAKPFTKQERNGVDEKTSVGPTSRRRTGCKRRMSAPKWLFFTSWWRETTSGTENVVNKKHALVRYQTATGEFEVELEGVPAVFEVSHATGRYGKIGIVDMRVGAQIFILGRQVVLKQCDGLTAKWLESEVKAITKAKAALIAALESGGYGVRIRCRSDRLQVAASIQRGGDSVGYAASMDRRSLLHDVVALRDMLAQRQPNEARRLTQAVL